MIVSWNILSKYRSELMAVAILWIMTFHVVELKHNQLPLVITDLYGVLFHGYIGVEIFLLLSGIGLYYSMQKDRDIWHFYKKRLNRLIVPYLTISILFFGYHDLVISNNGGEFLKDLSMYSFWAEGDRAVWFIALLIPLYLMYPLVFKVVISNHFWLKIIFLITLTYIGMMILKIEDSKAYMKIEIALTRIPIFFIGGGVGRLVYEKAHFK